MEKEAQDLERSKKKWEHFLVTNIGTCKECKGKDLELWDGLCKVCVEIRFWSQCE